MSKQLTLGVAAIAAGVAGLLTGDALIGLAAGGVTLVVSGLIQESER